MPIIIPIIWLVGTCVCAGGVCYCGKKAHDAYKEGQKTRRERLGINKAVLEEKRKENEDLTKRNKELEDKLKEGENQEKQIEKQISDIKKELEDPNITKQREEELRGKLAFLATQLDEVKRTNKKYRDEINTNNKRKKDNSKIINNTVSNPDNKHWIWNFLTLENIVIMGACYAMYKILKEEK